MSESHSPDPSTPPADHPHTLGQLRETAYRYRPVKQELRENLVAALRAERPLFPELVGYQDTVVPQIVNGVLARHDLLLLGLRGQAKTRMIRALPSLLDEWVPIVDGIDIPDDPLHPSFQRTRDLIAAQGDQTPIRWLHRSARFHEKLATPDVTIADLIGEVDLIKHAEGRHLADEGTMHFGLVPRSNRCIFAMNELPDLAPRIQVGLFNVLEERDVQIRGYPIRLHLDLMLVFSANPEDYTNRGRIVTPLKDRIGSVVRTHYPYDNETAMTISGSRAALEREAGGLEVKLPRFMHEVVEETIRLARNSPHINQQSGVSVRASITALEAVTANAEQRAVVLAESAIVPRPSDLPALHAACRGKVELMLAEDESTEEKLIAALVGEAVKNTFSAHADADALESVIDAFQRSEGSDAAPANIEVGDDVASVDVIEAARPIPGLLKAATALLERVGAPADDPQHAASAIEFILEGLHVHDKLSKYTFRERTYYRG